MAAATLSVHQLLTLKSGPCIRTKPWLGCMWTVASCTECTVECMPHTVTQQCSAVHCVQYRVAPASRVLPTVTKSDCGGVALLDGVSRVRNVSLPRSAMIRRMHILTIVDNPVNPLHLIHGTAWRTRGGFLRQTTPNRRCTRRCPRATCARAPFFSTRSPGLLWERTERFEAPRSICDPVGSSSLSSTTRPASS